MRRMAYIVPTLALLSMVIVAGEYTFPVGFDGQVETNFVGKATTPDDVIVDIVAFCSRHLQSTYCSASNLPIISKHAVDVVKSERLLVDFELQDVCDGTMIGADAVVVAQMAQELRSMAATSSSKVTKYVEVGSYLGCSTLIVANITAETGVLLYAHDVWVENMEELAPGSDPPPLTDDYFHRFYASVTRRGFERTIIPIRGPSTYTLAIHATASIDLAFVDGDHSGLSVRPPTPLAAHALSTGRNATSPLLRYPPSFLLLLYRTSFRSHKPYDFASSNLS